MLEPAKIYVVFRHDEKDNIRRYFHHGWWSPELSNAEFYTTVEAADQEAAKHPGARRGTLCIIDDFGDLLPA